MTNKYHIIIVTALFVSLIGLSFCQDADEDADQTTQASNATGMNYTEDISENNTAMTNSPQGDLINSGSPQAATISGSNSITNFAKPTGAFNPDVGLKLVAEGLTAPMVAVSPDDGTGRLFIVDQTGIVRVMDANGTLLDEPFLDVRDRMVKLSPAYDERGLLSIAFHPDFKDNGRVYAFYSAPLRQGAPEGWNCTNHLSEFSISKDRPNVVDMASEKVLMEIDKPQMNHNGGLICFGKDGYLYVPTGDGGGADDVGTGHTPGMGNAQDMTKVLGKILRIDINKPSGGKPYGIPADNPFTGNQSILPEIYASGLRNPAFMSIDKESGTPLVGNAGQELFESIYVIWKGANYGWHIREGTHCFDPNNPKTPPTRCRTTGRNGEPLIGPVVELGHDVGEVIIGGYVYRGSAMPELQGRYIFGDWTGVAGANRTLLVATPPSGWNWNLATADKLRPENAAMWETTVLRVPANANQSINALVRGFGEDAKGELYVMTSNNVGPSGTTGKVYKIVPVGATASTASQTA